MDAAEVSLARLLEFTEGADQFHAVLVEYTMPETKALVSQVFHDYMSAKLKN